MSGVRKRWYGAAANIRVHEGLVRGLGDASGHLLEQSNDRVPLGFGGLESTGTASVDEAKPRAAVSYDGEYAVRQHEVLDFQHDAGRTAKYLEEPFETERERLLELIAAGVRRELR